jgi:hypothetical protein
VVLVDDTDAGWHGEEGVVACVRTAGGTGFSRAANAGLEKAESMGFAWALVLNDDAAPEPGCVSTLLATAQRLGAGAVGPVLTGPAGVESAGIRYAKHTGRVAQVHRVPTRAQVVDALSGACLLVPTTERFDTRFPHGFEDVDLCQRLKAGGRQVWVEPAACCWHEGGGTVDRKSRQAARDAVVGHLHLVGPKRFRRAAVVAWAVAQVVREGGPAHRLAGILEGYRGAGTSAESACSGTASSAASEEVRAAAMASGRAGSNSIM